MGAYLWGKSNVAGKSLAVNGWEVVLGEFSSHGHDYHVGLSTTGCFPWLEILRFWTDSEIRRLSIGLEKNIRLEFLGTEVVFWVGKMARHLSTVWADAAGSMLQPLVAVHMYLWKWVYSISWCVCVFDQYTAYTCITIWNVYHTHKIVCMCFWLKSCQSQCSELVTLNYFVNTMSAEVLTLLFSNTSEFLQFH